MSVFETDEQIINHLSAALDMAQQLKSNLSDRLMLSSGIIGCYGMSGFKTRHLINNMANVPGLKYAEVGTYMGSTLFSALYKNEITALACDNWSEFGGPRDIFIQNINTYVAGAQSNAKQSVQIFEKDFNELELVDQWADIDFYNFDGPHDELSQYNGICKMYPALSDRFLLFVDDWYWSPPRDGTFRALKDLDVQVLFKHEIAVDDEVIGPSGAISNRFEQSEWHNGIAIFACKKHR